MKILSDGNPIAFMKRNRRIGFANVKPVFQKIDK